MILPVASASDLQLSFERLASSVSLLPASDQDAVKHVIDMIRKGEDALALGRLAALNKTSPKSSALRVLASYALLQTGNLLGAFDNAKQAEKAPDADGYECWYLAKIAWLVGDKPTCKREIGHLKKGGALAPDIRDMARQLQGH